MDRIAHVDVALYQVPLKKPASDAKVLTGRQRPLSHISLLVAEIETVNGARGLGFSYALRAGGQALLAHARELAPELLGEDPRDIGRLWQKIAWMGASVARTGVSVQAIAAFDIALWDLKARGAGMSLGKLLGAYRDASPCYNTSGGYLSTPLPEMLANVEAALERGIGGVKLKVGQPDLAKDIERVTAVRAHVGDAVPIMVDANQQWDFATALRAGRLLDPCHLTFLEEPVQSAMFVPGDAAGFAATRPLAIATTPGLRGLAFYAQAVVLDPLGSAGGLAASAARRLVVGD